jgi:preprotein translocase subunit SecB
VKRSPLKVKNYFVTGLSVKATPVMEGTQVPLAGDVNVTTKVEAAQRADNKRDWKVALQLNCEPADKNAGAYVVAMELIGFFEVDSELSEDRIGDVVAANAPAILYSAARELILLITGRGPFPPLSLPSATFIDETPTSIMNRVEAQKAAADKPKQPA